MKKLIFTFLAVFILIGFVFSQNVTLSQPNPASKWMKGKTYTIQWTRPGRMPSHVEISIMSPENRRFTRLIVKRTPNNGQYKWTVPQDIPAGKYEVRLKTVDGTSVARSKVFQIIDPPKTMRTMSKKRTPTLRTLPPLDPSIKSQHVRIEQNLIPQTKNKLNRLAKSLYGDMKRMKFAEFHQAALKKARKDFPGVSQKQLDVVMFYSLNEIDKNLRQEIKELQEMSDMSQLDMMKLQDAMNKQAQLMQMMSNMMKVMHDTSMAIIRNMK
ncbi:MAG: Ser-Thr-rich GPI-anchored membrane family protein [Candidatus Aminicenantes bacterium]|jgi:hypothetical protein